MQRGARGSTLTDVGRRYRAQIVGDLLRLQNHTLEAMAQRPDGARLLVGCVPVFAERWLLPRLPAFLAAHKGCSLHLQVYPRRFTWRRFRSTWPCSTTTRPGLVWCPRP